MKMFRFEGATMRDAIAKVKAELGDQAVILSTREVRRGLLGTAVEISAAIDDDDDAGRTTNARTNTMSGPSLGGPMSRAEPDVEKLLAPMRSELRSLRALVRASGDGRGQTELRAELSALRKLVDELGHTRDEPVRAPARTALPTRPATRELEDDTDEVAPRLSSKTRAMLQVAASAPLTCSSSSRILMLVGPTGAGKTTTIAKLAARAALIEGKRVRLITLDNYRVGGIDQIRTFADLIGVPLEIAESPAALHTLVDAADELTLIDTAGRSPRDTASIAELAGGLGSLPAVEVHLVVPAATSAAGIDELAARFRPLLPARLLFTKLDEVDAAPELATAPRRTGLPITWLTTGQAVPEDIEEPTSARVLELATAPTLASLIGPTPTRNRTHRAA